MHSDKGSYLQRSSNPDWTETYLAILELETYLLKEILNSQIKPKNLYDAIKSCPSLTAGKNKLRPFQKKICLLSASELPDYDKFDENLLHKLIQHLCPSLGLTQACGTEESFTNTQTFNLVEHLEFAESASYRQIGEDILRLTSFKNASEYYGKSFKEFWEEVHHTTQRIVDFLKLSNIYQQLVEIGHQSFKDFNVFNFFIILMMDEGKHNGKKYRQIDR